MDDVATSALGRLVPVRALDHPELLAEPVRSALPHIADADRIGVVEIDPALAGTGAFCEHYGVRHDESANCVIVAARKEAATRFAACVVLAATRTDVNGVVRQRLGARKVSFASMDAAVSETGMEHGGITPLGLPAGWPVLVDRAVAVHPRVVVGSGLRTSKLVLPGNVLAALPHAEVVDGLGR